MSVRCPHHRNSRQDWHVHTLHNLTQPVLRLPRLGGIIIEVNHVLYRLVAVSVVTHIHDLHLSNFVDDTAIITFVKYRRQHKHGIHYLVEGVLATHQVNESLRIVENRP